MFNKKKNPDQITFDDVIDKGLDEVHKHDVCSEKYSAGAENIKRMVDAKAEMHGRKPSWDILVAAGTNILGIAMIMNFEKAQIITSKAFSLIGKRL